MSGMTLAEVKTVRLSPSRGEYFRASRAGGAPNAAFALFALVWA
jgi:hypothetical protein